MYKHKEALKTSIDHLRNKQNVTQLTFQRTRLNVQRLSRPFIFRVGRCETRLRQTNSNPYTAACTVVLQLLQNQVETNERL